MTCGIICEYNPMHRGHEYMIGELRRAGVGTVVCLMSGSFVQRGDTAVTDKYDRAAAAVRSGADLVLELPFPWSCASAAYFAAAGVHILSALGIGNIAFGSESAELSRLRAAAEAADADEYEYEYEYAADASQGSAAAYFARIEGALGDGERLPPNDILGVEYIRAARRLGTATEFIAIKRAGAGFHDTDASAALPSATAMRAAILHGELPAGLTEASADSLRAAIAAGRAPATLGALGTAALWRFRSGGAVLGRYAECGGGVSGRLVRAAAESGNLADMLTAAATKKYTSARLRRAVIFALAGVMKADLDALPSYTTVLASDARGRSFLAAARKNAGITVLTRPSAALRVEGDAARRQTELLLASEGLYSLALPVPRPAGSFMRQTPLCID